MSHTESRPVSMPDKFVLALHNVSFANETWWHVPQLPLKEENE